MDKISLKAARVNAGFTQEELAKKLNKHVTTIINWEKKPFTISMGDFQNLCTVLNVPMEQIFLNQQSTLS